MPPLPRPGSTAMPFAGRLAQGTDPVAAKRAEKRQQLLAAEHTIEAVAREWLSWWGPTRSARHVGYVSRRLEQDVFPGIGDRPVAEVQPTDLVALVKAIEQRGRWILPSGPIKPWARCFDMWLPVGWSRATRLPSSNPLTFWAAGR